MPSVEAHTLSCHTGNVTYGDSIGWTCRLSPKKENTTPLAPCSTGVFDGDQATTSLLSLLSLPSALIQAFRSDMGHLLSGSRNRNVTSFRRRPGRAEGKQGDLRVKIVGDINISRYTPQGSWWLCGTSENGSVTCVSWRVEKQILAAVKLSEVPHLQYRPAHKK